MFWKGKLFGALIGYWLGRWPGLVLGLLLGHLYDKWQEAKTVTGAQADLHAPMQQVFFRTTFSVMGHLAKADGQVSEAEIAATERVMARMSLTPEQRQEAIHWFNQGKQSDFSLDSTLDNFRQMCRWRQQLILVFLEMQLQVALADKRLDPAESRLLGHIFERLGYSRQIFEQLVAMMRGAQHYYDYSHAGTSRPARPSLTDAYAVIGVPEGASDAEIKKAYRRLMSQHHPDKLVAKGLPKEMINVAKEKVQEINMAYDQIMKTRG
jgi:DnaJ like chaperone protein